MFIFWVKFIEIKIYDFNLDLILHLSKLILNIQRYKNDYILKKKLISSQI